SPMSARTANGLASATSDRTSEAPNAALETPVATRRTRGGHSPNGFSVPSCQSRSMLLEDHPQGAHDGPGTRRAAADVAVDGDEAVDAAARRVRRAEDAARDGARAHGDDEARARHGVERAHERELEVGGDDAGDEQQVGVARAGDEVDAEPRHVVARRGEPVQLPVAAVAAAGVEVADVERAAQAALDGLREALGLLADALAVVGRGDGGEDRQGVPSPKLVAPAADRRLGLDVA